MIAGPFCSQILADLGAEVIRIESAGSDPMRAKYPVYNGMSAMFEQMNCGKKSVGIDIKTDEGRQLIYDLVSEADMFLQNSRPGVMSRHCRCRGSSISPTVACRSGEGLIWPQPDRSR